ncbi:MAG: histidine kinase N-terminal 7TM domain-containing protein [Haloarculaceae archaeon]
MFPGPEQYALFLLLTIAPTGYLIWKVHGHRASPSGRWFVVMLVGMIGWSLYWALMLLFDSYNLSLASLNIEFLFVNITVIGWFFVAVEYVWQKRVGPRLMAPVLVIPVLTQLLIWTNPLHHLVWQSTTYADANGVIHPSRGLWFFVHTGYSYLLVFAAGMMLIGTLVDREGLYRKQTLLLILGWSIPVVTSAAFVAGVIPTAYLNPTPFGFLIGASIWAWGLYRYRLLESVPIARRRALNEMDEGMLIVDERGIITDANPAVLEMLDLDSSPVGRALEDVDGLSEASVSCVDGESLSDEPITLTTGDEQRHLTVSTTRIAHNGPSIGEVIVLNDQTDLIRYEQDLELLKEVLARVFRHDFRNKLNIVRAHGEMLANVSDDQQAAQAETIVETADRILNTSEKARVIGSLVEADRELYDVDITHVVSDTVGWATDQYPDAEIDCDLPEQAWVKADEALSLAVRNLVENAILHNNSDAPHVSIRVTTLASTARLIVEDDGPGMARYEQEIFSDRSIDQLNHSTGLGLWLVNWVIRNSGADIEIERSDTGTRVILEFQRSFDQSTSDDDDGPEHLATYSNGDAR